MKVRSRSPKETERIAGKFAKSLKRGTVVGLIGDLGSGKTTFVKGMARGMGIDPNAYVSSPTFTLVNIYDPPVGRESIPLVHVDFYRLEKEGDLDSLGLEDYYDVGVIAIEWAEKFQKKMDFQVHLKNTENEKERTIEIL